MKTRHVPIGPALVLAGVAFLALTASQAEIPRADPAVAKAVEEAAAALPATGAERAPEPQRPHALQRLSSTPRRCSPFETAAVVAITATCVRFARCTTQKPGPAEPRPAPTCDVVPPTKLK